LDVKWVKGEIYGRKGFNEFTMNDWIFIIEIAKRLLDMDSIATSTILFFLYLSFL
jgi:hypothetical protein